MFTKKDIHHIFRINNIRKFSSLNRYQSLLKLASCIKNNEIKFFDKNMNHIDDLYKLVDFTIKSFTEIYLKYDINDISFIRFYTDPIIGFAVRRVLNYRYYIDPNPPDNVNELLNNILNQLYLAPYKHFPMKCKYNIAVNIFCILSDNKILYEYLDAIIIYLDKFTFENDIEKNVTHLKNMIKKLHKFSLYKKNFIDVNDELVECCVCYEHNKEKCQSTCKHIFCVECIDHWITIEDKDTCPYCRTMLVR